MPDLIIQTAFNLYVGDSDADNDKRLVIKNLKLPEHEEVVQEHHSGGSIGAIEVGNLGMTALTASFKHSGWDGQSMSQFGIGGRTLYPYTAFGYAIRKSNGSAVQIIAKMLGRMTKIQIPELKRGDLMEVDYEIKEILAYQLFYDGKEKFYYNWVKSLWRVDGQVQNQDELNALGIATGGTGTTTSA